jgi:hypothetical protein
MRALSVAFFALASLVHCDPKNNFQELATVKRSDRRCDRYEDLQ